MLHHQQVLVENTLVLALSHRALSTKTDLTSSSRQLLRSRILIYHYLAQLALRPDPFPLSKDTEMLILSANTSRLLPTPIIFCQKLVVVPSCIMLTLKLLMSSTISLWKIILYCPVALVIRTGVAYQQHSVLVGTCWLKHKSQFR